MALELAMDYEWMNRQLFRGSYKRVKGVFGNTDCEANGVPSPQEVALLEPFRVAAARRSLRDHGGAAAHRRRQLPARQPA